MGFRGISPRNVAMRKNGLRELTRNLAEFSPRKFAFENFRGASPWVFAEFLREMSR